jgi:hypothetical protein
MSNSGKGVMEIAELNQLSESDIRVIKEYFKFMYPDLEELIDSRIWKIDNIEGRNVFFFFGIFFSMTEDGKYQCKRMPDEPDEPWGTEGWMLITEDLKPLLYGVGLMRYNFQFKEFFENQYSFKKEEFIPYTSRFECSKRGIKYDEEFDDYELEDDDFEDGDEWKRGDNECM